MRKLHDLWRNTFDVREGELARVIFMALYLLFVLFAYYILKAVSRAMFLAEFDIDKLPHLYILVASIGGFLAYFYTRLAVKTSLKTAVNAATFFMIACLVLIWWLLGFGWDWMIYVFSIFVSLFSITLAAQGWLVAANVFTTAEAKRLYGLLGIAPIAGAAFGGQFAATTVHYIGSRNLLLAAACMVVLAYCAFLGVVRLRGEALSRAKGADEEETFSFSDITSAVRQHRHLQVIISIICVTYVVDVMIEYQFNAIARQTYGANVRELTAFLGNFYGIWLNLVTFVLQSLITVFVVSRFGVGGALFLVPASIAVASVGIIVSPNVLSTGAARLTEAATRYTFNRTGMELLYLPLPTELKNRTKAFMDVFVDRLSRGVGGLLLILLTTVLSLDLRQLSMVVIAFTFVWMFLSMRAKREYVTTVQNRLSARRLNLEDVRVNLKELNTVRLLEQTAQGDNARQASYALALLADAAGYPVGNLLGKLVDSKSPELRAKVYEIALARGIPEYYENAIAEVRSSRFGDETAVVKPAVDYALAMSTDTVDLAQRLLTHPNRFVAASAMESLAGQPDAARKLITKEWLAEAVASPDPVRRQQAAVAIRGNSEADPGLLHKLLLDRDTDVAAAAMKTAAHSLNRIYLDGLLRRLGNVRSRGLAIESLAAFGEKIVGTLGDVLLDDTMPLAVRRQIPRVLQRIPHQRSVDVLLGALTMHDLSVRASVLKALNRLRDTHVRFNYGRDSVMQHIWAEARYYYEMNAALAAFEEKPGNGAARLLASTLKDRLRSTLERLFRLLGLRYPPREIYAAYLAVNRPKSEEFTAAVEFLDNVLEPELKRLLMPLLDDGAHVARKGRELFGIEEMSPRDAVRELLRSGDSWLTSCAVATAAELQLRDLIPQIAPLSERAGTEVGRVAKDAMAVLA